MIIVDHNISHRLCTKSKRLNLIPVSSLEMDQDDDYKIWEYASLHGCHLMSKDKDFVHLVNYYGQPPKLIWLDIGNTTFRELEKCILNHESQILKFLEDKDHILRIHLIEP